MFDTDTLTFTTIGEIEGASFPQGARTTWDDSTKTIYVISRSAGDKGFYKLDPTTAALTLIGQHGIAGISGLAYSPRTGRVYASGSGGDPGFYSIDVLTGNATLIGTPSGFDIDGLLYDPVRNKIIANAGMDYGFLHEIDPLRGSGRQIFFVDDMWGCTGFTHDAETGLYWLFIDWDNGEALTFDPANGFDYVDMGWIGVDHTGLCAADPDPVCLDLEIDPLVGGAPAGFEVSQGQPGYRVAIVWGLGGAPTDVDNIGGWCATFGFKLKIQGSNSRIVGSGVLNSVGRLIVRRWIPKDYSGQEILFQAATHNTCPAACMSDVIARTIN